MGNLIKPADYASKMGISRQAVYAKIKKGILSSRNIAGKIFIVLDSEVAVEEQSKTVSIPPKKEKPDNGNHRLLEAKDETISVLKETIADLKETNKMITSTLRGEVELLKEAFSEMKMLYGLQLEHKKAVENGGQTIEVDNIDIEEPSPEEWMELSDFYALHNITKKKKQKKIKKQLKKQLKKGNPRIDKFNGEILLVNADFEDVLAKA